MAQKIVPGSAKAMPSGFAQHFELWLSFELVLTLPHTVGNLSAFED